MCTFRLSPRVLFLLGVSTTRPQQVPSHSQPVSTTRPQQVPSHSQPAPPQHVPSRPQQVPSQPAPPQHVRSQLDTMWTVANQLQAAGVLPQTQAADDVSIEEMDSNLEGVMDDIVRHQADGASLLQSIGSGNDMDTREHSGKRKQLSSLQAAVASSVQQAAPENEAAAPENEAGRRMSTRSKKKLK